MPPELVRGAEPKKPARKLWRRKSGIGKSGKCERNDEPADQQCLEVLREGAGDVEDGEKEVGGNEDGATTELLRERTAKKWKISFFSTTKREGVERTPRTTARERILEQTTRFRA
jgi:hypothetical protein